MLPVYETAQLSLIPGCIFRFKIMSGFVFKVRSSMLSFRVGLPVSWVRKLALTKSNMVLLSFME